MTFLRYFDVVLIVVAAPIMLLIGVPATGYLIGAGAWIALRAVSVYVDRVAGGIRDAGTQVSVRLGLMLGRLFALALAVIVARQAGRNDGLTALVVVAVGFTVSFAVLPATRPRSR
jgi:hypothetical protein